MKDAYVHKTAIIDRHATIGNCSKIWHFVHIREYAKIGNNVVIGKSSYIDSTVHIGNNVKIQNMVSIYRGVTIKNDVFIGPHVTFTNDLRPRATGDWKLLETFIEKGVSVGANATIICGITLGQYCFVAAGAVVTKDVPPHALTAGNPSRVIGWVCFCGQKIGANNLKGSQSLVCKQCKKINKIVVPQSS